jgi:hypothetical protein
VKSVDKKNERNTMQHPVIWSKPAITGYKNRLTELLTFIKSANYDYTLANIRGYIKNF